MKMVCCAFVMMAGMCFVRAAAGSSAWTSLAGNVIIGEVISPDATSLTLVTGAVPAEDRVPAARASRSSNATRSNKKKG